MTRLKMLCVVFCVSENSSCLEADHPPSPPRNLSILRNQRMNEGQLWQIRIHMMSKHALSLMFLLSVYIFHVFYHVFYTLLGFPTGPSAGAERLRHGLAPSSARR